MKKIYFICLILIGILGALYIYSLCKAGLSPRLAAVLLLAAAVTVGAGLLIVKLLTKKIRKNMEDN